jgi:hypothetical protein
MARSQGEGVPGRRSTAGRLDRPLTPLPELTPRRPAWKPEPSAAAEEPGSKADMRWETTAARLSVRLIDFFDPV